ncbi:MAG: HU family DNA-binding protein [Pseudomonadota bacterium]
MATKAAASRTQTPSRPRKSFKSGPVAARAVSKVPAPAHPVAQDKQAEEHALTETGAAPLRKRELVQEISDRTGLAKGRVRPVVEAMLDVLGETIAADRPLQLPPFGKLKPQRSKMQGNARITHAKIRQSSTGA